MGDPDSYGGEYEFQVPIFVLTHHWPERPPKQDERLTFTFVTDGAASATDQAKAAGGDKAIQVVGLVDELRVDVMPVVLGGGLRLSRTSIPSSFSSRRSTCGRSEREPASGSASSGRPSYSRRRCESSSPRRRAPPAGSQTRCARCPLSTTFSADGS